MADENADMKRKTDMTSDRMFFGALVNAYSSPVIEAKISLIAISTYLQRESEIRTAMIWELEKGGGTHEPLWIQTLRGDVSGFPAASTQSAAKRPQGFVCVERK